MRKSRLLFSSLLSDEPRAADAASHLFFAYLRSLSPENVAGASGISKLPRSLQSLLSQTEYPPERPTLMFTRTSKVVMIVDTVSPTPFALLRRARNFEYRDDDYTLAMYSQFEDPVKALTDECRRVLNAISSANQSALVMNGSAKAQDPSWSRFEDLGFSGLGDSNTPAPDTFGPQSQARAFGGMRGQGSSRTTDFGRPTTPSWADFLSTGFVQDVQAGGSTPMLLPPDKVLPPIGEGRGHSSQSHVRNGTGDHLEPGELASITTFELDDTFWWVWMTSLASEEPAERKAVFGRCALIETDITSGGGRWLVMEEQVKGASPGPEEGAYIAEKKSRFTFRRKGGLTRRKSTGKKPQQPPKESYDRTAAGTPNSRTTIGADQQAKIQAAAQELVQANEKSQPRAPNRTEDKAQSKTTSMLTIGTNIMNEASPAMQWAKQYDRGAIRAKYLGDTLAGTGRSMEHLATIPSASALTPEGNGSLTPRTPKLQRELSNRELPAIPKDDTGLSTPRAHQEAISPPPLPPSTPTNQGASAAPGSDEKKSKDRHPALRDYSFDSSKEMPLKPSPESPRTERTKLKKEQALKKKAKPEKKGDGGGLKKLFTKKGKENRMSRTIQPQPRKEEHLRAETPDSYAQAHVSEEPPAREPARAEPVLMPPEPQDDYQSDLSRVHTNEEREAAQAFNRFDQGPLNDVPAFVPTESPNPETEETAPTPPEFPRSRSQVPVSSPSRRPLPAESPIVSPVEPRAPRTDEVLSPTVAPPTDRWAQIRKNAAERAQRMSEDQSGPAPSASQKSAVPSSHGNTDDGDTSGEETIESRVARIKARVAELTGNMEQQGNARR